MKTKPKLAMLKNWFFLMKPVWKYGKSYVLLAVFMPIVCNVITSYVSTSMNRDIIDAITNQISFADIIMIALFYEGLLAFTIIIDSFISLKVQNKTFHRITAKLRKEVYEKAIKTDLSNTDNPKFYDAYTWTITEYPNQADGAVMLLARILSSIASILTVFSVISYLSWFVILLTFILTIITLPLDNALAKETGKKKEEINLCNRRLNYIQRIFYQKDYLSVLRITDVVKSLFFDFDKTIKRKLQIQDKHNLKIWVLTTIQTIVRHIFSLLIIGFYIGLIINGKMSIGSFVSIMSAVTILRKTFINFNRHYKDLKEIQINCLKVYDFFHAPSPIETFVGGQSINIGQRFDIEFKNVSFTYPNSSQGISNINFKIVSGMKIGIVGKNGAGKTTLLKLLLRLYTPKSGEITLNGFPIEDYSLNDYRKCIGVALQDSHIFALSLRENLEKYGSTTDTQISSVLQQLSLENIIKLSKNNYNVSLTREFDKDGIELSGGEKQKIGIASVLLHTFNLLVLDEPSASLDPISEHQLNQLMLSETQNTTTIMVSHRLSTVKKADVIIVMDDGKIVDIGNHDALMERRGLYFEMYDKQSQEYK